MTSRGLNIEFFSGFSSVFAFALPFCIIFLVESHEGEHEGRLVESFGREL